MHGKGACDGIRDTVKRNAYRTSFKRDFENFITTTENFFEWATKFFKKIKYIIAQKFNMTLIVLMSCNLVTKKGKQSNTRGNIADLSQ